MIVAVLAAALGKRRSRDEVAPYLRSLRRMLSEDPAAAEDPSHVGEVRPESVEGLLSLGELLRRKGDLGGAIRVHQALGSAPSLSLAMRRAAGVELARDFRQAGLLGRAQQTLSEVIAGDPSHVDAHRIARDLHEQLGEWAEAVVSEERLADMGAGTPGLLAHLRARHARALLGAGRLDDARNVAERAVGLEPASADAWLSLGEVRLARREGSGALEAIVTASSLRPEALPLLFPRVEQALELDPAGVGIFLGERLRERPDDPLLRLALARHLRRRGQLEPATEVLEPALAAEPSLVEARQELAAILLEPAASAALTARLSALLAAPAGAPRTHRCTSCKLSVLSFDFRCSMCGAWDTVEPAPGPLRAASS